VKLSVEPIEARLRAPFSAAHGAVAARELLLVSIEDRDGQVGYGEAGPIPSYDGASIDDVRRMIEACRAVLEAGDGVRRADLVARCAEVATLPQALAAIDLALWDLEGRRADRPLWSLLGAEDPEPVAVNWTIAASDRAGAAREAAAARAAGFSTVKVKVAIGDDAGRLAAVRAVAGPEMRIRIDANGAWSEAEALANLRALEPAGIELCEEPAAGVEAIAALATRTAIPLALDESAADPAALRSRRACDLVCLKVAGCGGITGLLAAAARARRQGYEVFLASTLDGPLGIAAALHAAAALGPTRACGLATLSMFEGRPDPLPPGAGSIEPPRSPGLGDGLLSWYGR